MLNIIKKQLLPYCTKQSLGENTEKHKLSEGKTQPSPRYQMVATYGEKVWEFCYAFLFLCGIKIFLILFYRYFT